MAGGRRNCARRGAFGVQGDHRPQSDRSRTLQTPLSLPRKALHHVLGVRGAQSRSLILGAGPEAGCCGAISGKDPPRRIDPGGRYTIPPTPIPSRSRIIPQYSILTLWPHPRSALSYTSSQLAVLRPPPRDGISARPTPRRSEMLLTDPPPVCSNTRHSTTDSGTTCR